MPTRSTSHIRTLQAGFGISFLILIASSIASYVSIKNLINSSDQVNHTNLVLQKLENAISFAKDAETGQRGFLLSGDSLFLDPYYGAGKKAMAEIDSVKKLTSDNPAQQRDADQLKEILKDRFDILEQSIRQRLLDARQLVAGKDIMDKARQLVINMQKNEQLLLQKRTASQDRFSAFTPVLIIIAAMISLFTTFYFYRKVNENFQAKTALTSALEEKDREITNRIDIIQDIAARISKGDYKIRLNNQETDGLGSLATSLNSMAISLDDSFTLLSDKQWLQTGANELNNVMAGEKDIVQLTGDVINQLAEYTGSQVGAVYLLENNNTLVLRSGYAYKIDQGQAAVKLGEGVVGQAGAGHKAIVTNDIPAGDFIISFGAGDVKPASIVAFPVRMENSLKAVIELGSLQSYTPLQVTFLNLVAENIGIAINTAQNRARLQELLEETQAQSEELQAQHSELENLNTELEAQAEKLQASEEELKVQQEELTETNHELQERSRLLEEKNQLVLHRNLEIQKKSEELSLSVKYKSEFLANMSHELRTPLNSILLLSRLLSENNDANLSSEQVEFARVIQSSGNNLLLLIDDILDLSKIESGKMELEYETVTIDELARDMQMLFEPLAKEKNIRFVVNKQQGVPATIETDKLRLEQIIKNLVSNAVKFTTEGSVELIFAPAPSHEGFIYISVKDTGIGIQEEKQRMIFEAFQQADGSTRRKYGGTGLGLSISRQLAQLLQGEIMLTSEPGKGSTFTLSIPVTRDIILPLQEKEEEETETSYEPEKKEPVKEPSPVYVAPHIPPDIPDDRESILPNDKVMLIVEDDAGFAHALLDFTRKKGYKAVVSVRGDRALELARRFNPAGILLDIQLPIKSGWEVMEELKSHRDTRHIPVHIMSSFEVKKQSISSGAIDFINKPMAFEQMESVFKKIEFFLQKDSRKVLIIEDNSRHAEALSYFLDTHRINSVISDNVETGLDTLQNKEVDCLILDMGIPDDKSYEALEALKINKGLEHIPVIIFTGKSLSRNEEMRIKKYADTIVVKTAHSYRRILDEVSLFLHIVEENTRNENIPGAKTKPLAEVLKNKVVLVADDDVRNIFSLSRVLEQHQMTVITAMNGKEALQVLQEKPGVDIVLMDMMMPELDGYEAIAGIRANSRWKDLPVIAVTAKAMTGDREKCIKAGASDYISKPVDMDQLISLLRIWLYDTTARKTGK